MGDHVEIGSTMFGAGRVPASGIELYLKEEREKRANQNMAKSGKVRSPDIRNIQKPVERGK